MADFTSPIGRIVWGSVFIPKTKSMSGAPLAYKDGTPRSEYSFGLAIPKNDPRWPATHQYIIAAAKEGFPSLINAQGIASRPDFAWKIKNGDDPQYKDYPGYPGCWILSMSSGKPSTCIKRDRSPVIDTNGILPGYWVAVSFYAKANGSTTKPGVFLNHRFILLDRVDTIITPKGQSAEDAFGDMLEGATTPPPVMTPPPPAMDFLTPKPPAAGPVMTAKAGAVSYEQFIAAGWTPEAMRKEGYLV